MRSPLIVRFNVWRNQFDIVEPDVLLGRVAACTLGPVSRDKN